MDWASVESGRECHSKAGRCLATGTMTSLPWSSSMPYLRLAQAACRPTGDQSPRTQANWEGFPRINNAEQGSTSAARNRKHESNWHSFGQPNYELQPRQMMESTALGGAPVIGASSRQVFRDLQCRPVSQSPTSGSA